MSKQQSRQKRRKARQTRTVKVRSPVAPPCRVFGGSKAERSTKACRQTDPRKEGQ